MNWANRTVFTGDNLDVLRGMDSATVDLIYADPPFNSNRDYAAPIGSEAAGAAFKDTWTLSDVDEAWLEIIRDQHPAPHAVIEAAGAAHGDGMKSYLCMMAIRLLELRRVLKPTGSIYLHCDDTASHYLKALMDSVFGVHQYRNAVVWRRYGRHNDSRRYGRVYDDILYYAAGEKGWAWNGAWIEHDPAYVAQAYRHQDERGRYRTAPLHTGGLQGGGYRYEFRGYVRTWRYPIERMRELEKDSRIRQGRNGAGIPERKVYLSESKGRPVSNIWDDVKSLTGKNRERTEYPTQKPLALLERIIAASSNPGDVVLDPFCGCATALIAAEKLTRQWVGVDISSLAVKLVRQRLAHEVPLFTQNAIDRTDVPVRTDLVDEVREYLNEKRALYGQQEGRCAGCRVHFELRNMEVDHVIPRVKGGPNHISNYQLLCGSCNRRKGAGSQAELIAKLKRDGIIAA